MSFTFITCLPIFIIFHLYLSMNKYSLICSTFLGTINHLLFTLLFISTSSRYHVTLYFFAISLYLYGAHVNVNVNANRLRLWSAKFAINLNWSISLHLLIRVLCIKHAAAKAPQADNATWLIGACLFGLLQTSFLIEEHDFPLKTTKCECWWKTKTRDSKFEVHSSKLSLLWHDFFRLLPVSEPSVFCSAKVDKTIHQHLHFP